MTSSDICSKMDLRLQYLWLSARAGRLLSCYRFSNTKTHTQQPLIPLFCTLPFQLYHLRRLPSKLVFDACLPRGRMGHPTIVGKPQHFFFFGIRPHGIASHHSVFLKNLDSASFGSSTWFTDIERSFDRDDPLAYRYLEEVVTPTGSTEIHRPMSAVSSYGGMDWQRL